MQKATIPLQILAGADLQIETSVCVDVEDAICVWDVKRLPHENGDVVARLETGSAGGVEAGADVDGGGGGDEGEEGGDGLGL